MKNFQNNLAVAAVTSSFVFGLISPIVALAAGPSAVNLGSAGNFTVLSKTGISTTGTTYIVGDIGLSPAAASYITGFGLSFPAASAFSTSAQVSGKVYAPGYADPTPAFIITAVSDMETAYTDAAGRTNPISTELGAGNIGGLTIAPGLYKWGTGVIIPADVTLSGGANDVWILQVSGNLNLSSATKIVLSGGAQAGNVFWVVAGQTTIGTTAVFNGTILDQTSIVLGTGAVLNGRALAQAAVTLDANTVTLAASTSGGQTTPTPVVIPVVTPTPTSTPALVPVSIPVMCTQEAMLCSDGSYVGRQGPTCAFNACPVATTQTNISASAEAQAVAVLRERLSALLMTAQSLQAKVQVKERGSSTGVSASAFGQQMRTIARSLVKGSNGDDVKILQQFLISQNKGSASRALAGAGSTAYFGSVTRAALAEFQASVGISPALGNFGAITRAYLKANY